MDNGLTLFYIFLYTEVKRCWFIEVSINVSKWHIYFLTVLFKPLYLQTQADQAQLSGW